MSGSPHTCRITKDIIVAPILCPPPPHPEEFCKLSKRNNKGGLLWVTLFLHQGCGDVGASRGRHRGPLPSLPPIFPFAPGKKDAQRSVFKIVKEQKQPEYPPANSYHAL